MEMAGGGADTDHVRIGKLPHPVQREHHRAGLLHQKGHRKGNRTEGERNRARGYHQHPGKGRAVRMARKELRGGYRPLPLTGQRGGGTERVLQQPGGGRRRVRGNHLRESAGTFQVQVPGDIRGPRTGREQDEKKVPPKRCACSGNSREGFI